MNEAWTGQVIGRLHVIEADRTELANKLGVTREYLSMILNGKKKPANAQEKIEAALRELEKDAESKAKPPAC